ncbi:MAG: hypothetical protein C4521_01040 [Actinobacteria bacterium]|nr:MAG: hypothetical protein C4521_01040 [Actinomycetota bacterium]
METGGRSLRTLSYRLFDPAAPKAPRVDNLRFLRNVPLSLLDENAVPVCYDGLATQSTEV